jgi:hypothetical protein
MSVHDGEMFAREVFRKDPRTPEASRMLIADLRLPSVYPVFVSPKRSYLQVVADTGFEKRDWMAKKASLFNERNKATARQTIILRVPLAEWPARGSDDEPPPAPRARRRHGNLACEGA